ncbi:DgyrCDS11677 [Dimorphilus gyrociliatus]|uniref:Male-enhanced antigen 1 n=1 Tax=Dimorphilus gyrociliatus TaxID=2664684 RepID=A0A7I8W5E8_9ANNE|nr:DgyrCDS11677 [Dimorphilus gyrociliatus]
MAPDPDEKTRKTDNYQLSSENENVHPIDDHSESSDDGGNEQDYSGYELLPQEVPTSSINEIINNLTEENIDNVIQSSIDSDSLTVGGTTTNSSQENSHDGEISERCSVWKTKRPSDNIPLDEDRASQIKNAMLKIQLPSSAHPTWAKDVSEDVWKHKLLKSLTHKS